MLFAKQLKTAFHGYKSFQFPFLKQGILLIDIAHKANIEAKKTNVQ